MAMLLMVWSKIEIGKNIPNHGTDFSRQKLGRQAQKL
jgi:hypothetical protein